jgi:DNA-binding transcriptional LysR family regulator
MALDPISHLQGISAFVHSVNAGSFAAAGSRMGLTQSAVGKSVARLEARLGVRLLERTTRTLSMTAEGQAYYQSCLKVLEELGSVEALLASRHREVSGRLRVNLPISFGRRWVMPELRTLASLYPKLTLDVSFTDRVVDLIEEGVDLVVRMGDPGDQASLMGRRIASQEWVLCGAPRYLDRRGRPQHVAEIEQHDCLVYMRDGRYLPWRIVDTNGETEVAKFEPRHVISHGEALRDAALAGMGLAYLPTWMIAADCRAGRLEAVMTLRPVAGSPIHVLWPRTRELVPKVRAAVDALVDAFLPLPPWDRLDQT